MIVTHDPQMARMIRTRNIYMYINKMMVNSNELNELVRYLLNILMSYPKLKFALHIL